MSASAAYIIIHKQNKLIDLFNEMNAIDAEHSISLDEIGIRRNFVFNRMMARGVFIQCNNNKYYINNQEVIGFKRNIRKRGLIALLIFILLGICWAILGM